MYTMFRSLSHQIVKRSRTYSTRLDCPPIPTGALDGEGATASLSVLLDDWRNTIVQLQDDADRLQWQVDLLNKRLAEKEGETGARRQTCDATLPIVINLSFSAD